MPLAFRSVYVLPAQVLAKGETLKHDVLYELIDALSLHKNALITDAHAAFVQCDLTQSEPEIIKRFVMPSALQYLILTPNTPVRSPPKTRLSPWGVDHSHPFGFFLYRLVTLSGGKPYLHTESGSGGWSSIINDLLRMGHTGMGKKANRGSPDLDTIVDYFNNFRDQTRYFADGPPEGVPLVIAIIQDTQ